jgi:regulator of protease activity HflC (stomatin/prohibitin superfamily)
MNHGLVNSNFRVKDMAEGSLETIPPNSDPFKNFLITCLCCPCLCFFNTFTTPDAHLQLVEDGRGGFKFYEPGVHLICDPFHTVDPTPKSYWQGNIQHGDKTVVVIEQGKIGFATDKGQPILLAPGLHTWKSATMRFVKSYDLNNNVISMPPLTLVTVDEGYSAVTEDNGKQRILMGGSCYLLDHRNWKFQKFISQKIQSHNLDRIRATSADNVLMAVDATVIWQIEDVSTAARNSAETIRADGTDTDAKNNADMKKLSNDVLKQAEASLASFIGSVNYSDTFNVASAVHQPELVKQSSLPEAMASIDMDHNHEERKDGGDNLNRMMSRAGGGTQIPVCSGSPLFDPSRVADVKQQANAVTCTYGVRIISINVVAAVPDDKNLMNSLAQGAVAAAEAQKYEIVARGKAAALTIEASAEAEAEVIKAKGNRQAADLVEESELASSLAVLDKTGEALADKSSFFFGADASALGSLLLPAAAKMATSGS